MGTNELEFEEFGIETYIVLDGSTIGKITPLEGEVFKIEVYDVVLWEYGLESAKDTVSDFLRPHT